MPGFIELIIQEPSRRGRRRRRRLSFITPAGLRCTITAGIPPALAERVLVVALGWRGGRRC